MELGWCKHSICNREFVRSNRTTGFLTMNRIRDQLFLGDALDAENPEKLSTLNIDTVISLTTDPRETTTIHQPLEDGENSPEHFNSAVDAVRDAYTANTTVLVHCAVGQSRAPTVLATALAAEGDQPFETVLDELKSERPIINPHPALLGHADEYLVS